MTLKTRLARLEGHRAPEADDDTLELNLPADLWARIAALQAAGTFPGGLSDADLDVLWAAIDWEALDAARGRI